MYNLLSELKNTLKSDKRLIIDGNLSKNKIVELALGMDTGLLKLLLANDLIKKHFFANVSGILVFDKIAFQNFVSNKSFLPDSYTAFKNKIGLTTNREYLSESREVVLDWPYKDCVLEGGQTKEDQKRSEIFWNQTLAADEIDRLLEPKVLTNFKKYTKNGEQAVSTVSIDDNLIIKGNNLLALHSLKQTYAGKVKLIYIDPPYNTGNDSFGYNDSFNHSTWLTFMKNRLEVAKALLRDDGVIFVQCDDNEQAYLKVLMDGVFGRDNSEFIIWNKEAEEKSGTLKQVNRIRSIHEIINIAYKNKNGTYFNKISEALKGREKELSTANLAVNDGKEQEGHENWMEIISPNGKRWFKHWKFNNQQIKQFIKEDLIYFGKDGNNQPRLILPMDERRKVYLSSIINKGSTTMGRAELNNLFKQKTFSFPKPEKLISDIIETSTQPNDLVLDYHLGSGTTCAVAHKMGRRYIGIEQMDYIQDIACKRLKKVISGEQGGISKTVNWQGGGEFIYCELAEHNAKIITAIEQATTSEQLQKLWQKIQNSDFISYQVKPQSINANITEFSALNIDEQKQLLIALLDKNQLYVNYADIDDLDYQISSEDKKLNHQFYGKPSW